MRPNARSLVVLSGPIAAGKSTLAGALAQRLAAAQVGAVAIDFDLVVDMVKQSAGFPGAMEAWRTARRAAAALTDGFFAAGVTVVVIEGDFWNPFARPDFEAHLRAGVAPSYVTVLVSYDEALRRITKDVADDPQIRPNSREPVFLKQVHDRFGRRLAELPAGDLVLDSERLTVDELVAEIIEKLQLLEPQAKSRD